MDREAYRAALESEILVLDDLGAHRVTDWVEDTVTSIVTQRCNNRRATIVTTNLRDPEVGDQRGSGLQDDIHSKYFLEERIGMRARSRLFEMCKLIKMSRTTGCGSADSDYSRQCASPRFSRYC
jgi:DNA replication protein DnaC